MPKRTTDGVADKIVQLKDSGKTWAQVAEQVNLPQGKAMFQYYVATVTPKTRITGKNDAELDRKIADARTEGLSWGQIAARSGKSEGYCRKAYEEVTGNAALGDRSAGKGGRFPGASNGAATKKAPAKKAAAKAVKKATAKKPAKAVAKRRGRPPGKKAMATSES